MRTFRKCIKIETLLRILNFIDTLVSFSNVPNMDEKSGTGCELEQIGLWDKRANALFLMQGKVYRSG